MSLPFSQFLFNQPLDAVLQQQDKEVVPGVSFIKRYEDVVTGKKFTGVYCSHINHLFLRDARTPCVCLAPIRGIRYIPFPTKKVLIWDVRRNGSSSVIRTRAALDGIRLSDGEPSGCHDKLGYRYERQGFTYNAEEYKDYRHIVFFQDGADRFIKLMNYWLHTGPADWYMYSWLPGIKTVRKTTWEAKVEWMLACSYINSFAGVKVVEPHTMPQYKYLDAVPRVDEIWRLSDMDKFFKEEMGIECLHANCESKAPVFTKDMLPDEWKNLIHHIYKKDNEIEFGPVKKETEEEDDERDVLKPSVLAVREVEGPRVAVKKKPEVFSLWVGDSLPDIAKMCIKSHLANDFNFRLFVYPHIFNKNAGIPAGCEIEDANEILDKDHIFLKGGVWQSYGMFSDLWRYAYFMKHDGCWMDMDFICLRPWKPTHWFYSSDGKPDTVDTNPLMIPKKHPLVQDMLNVWLYPNELDKQAQWVKDHFSEFHKGDTSQPLIEQLSAKHYGWGGSGWLHQGLLHYKLEDKIGVLPGVRHWNRRVIGAIVKGEVRADDPRLQECQALHLCSSLTRYKVQEQALQNKDSLMYHLWKLYLA